MKPIVLDGLEHLSNIDEFNQTLLRLCKQHKLQGRAMAFAFIVYDFTDAHIRKILSDDDYYQSLNKISGEFLTIFYIDSKKPRKSKKRRSDFIDDLDPASTATPADAHFRYMFGFDFTDDSPLDSVNSALRETFGIDGYVNSPFVIFFQSDGEQFSAKFCIELKAGEIEKAFNELKSCIQDAVNAARKVRSEFRNDGATILNLIESSVRNGIRIRFIKTKLTPIAIGALASLVQTLIMDRVSGKPH